MGEQDHSDHDFSSHSPLLDAFIFPTIPLHSISNRKKEKKGQKGQEREKTKQQESRDKMVVNQSVAQPWDNPFSSATVKMAKDREAPWMKDLEEKGVSTVAEWLYLLSSSLVIFKVLCPLLRFLGYWRRPLQSLKIGMECHI